MNNTSVLGIFSIKIPRNISESRIDAKIDEILGYLKCQSRGEYSPYLVQQSEITRMKLFRSTRFTESKTGRTCYVDIYRYLF